ncbi:hypothetical protein GXM_00510 [Nostoc sphaeroides CCNUC1]|uniref:Uncharacterized protein n=1 Tax=Nostoc sphaeroides CCNUC1 TaxID=2653204 RepID=A0A5P8VRS2_9NOSO|nr:hypothetical protein GXM_00510 [Nostoc sphaeroides CCNUC1]
MSAIGKSCVKRSGNFYKTSLVSEIRCLRWATPVLIASHL